ncbi:SWIM zinc finger family protein [Pectinatus brassicae]|uniref:SWIM-type domain-containing protein n=1 Tax=Pectinatus brassicae TaxID=862415 RepID=A0A840UK93_9FIRM|nr:SWIM zinc finger family protein [Pectinatus brassicae]MBB5337556.1 hypothetical protein [Pectinatus brassicae]
MNFWNQDSLSLHQSTEQMKKQISLSSLKSQKINKDTRTALISDEDENIFQTSLTECTCSDFQRDHLPCQHMYHLANKLKLFVIRKNKRSNNLIADFSSGYAGNWFFCY